jgi:malonyl-CoA/methylmalonyl-CoA synthetase
VWPLSLLGERKVNVCELLLQKKFGNRSRNCIETQTGKVFNYDDVDAYSGRLANVLICCGVESGDRVAVQADKSPYAVFLYLACLRIGAVYVPLNPSYSLDETDHYIADAGPKLVVCQPERIAEISTLCHGRRITTLTLGIDGTGSLADKSRSMPAIFTNVTSEDNELAAILYSSGTTGRPKGAMLTHGNLISNAEALIQTWDFSEKDILLHALPIFHAHGLFVALHCALISGASLLFLPRFDATQVIAALARATVFMGVPTYYSRLLALPEFDGRCCQGMRLFISGSAPLLSDTFEQFRQRTGRSIVERYGLTETLINTSNPLQGIRLPGSVGPPLPGVQLRTADSEGRQLVMGSVGEVQVRGANVFPGYWRNPEMSAASFTSDGFFRTGDLGRMDEHGYLSIVGRAKDMIISGGYNVYPKEVEDCLTRLDSIDEAAVVGMPHPDFGEAVIAVIVARSGKSLDVKGIKPFLRSYLANYKLPKCIVLTNDLPRNAIGKIQKNVLRQQYLQSWNEYLAGELVDGFEET